MCAVRLGSALHCYPLTRVGLHYVYDLHSKATPQAFVIAICLKNIEWNIYHSNVLAYVLILISNSSNNKM